MIPSYFKIEILAIQDEFFLLGHKGLTTSKWLFLKQSPSERHLSALIGVQFFSREFPELPVATPNFCSICPFPELQNI